MSIVENEAAQPNYEHKGFRLSSFFVNIALILFFVGLFFGVLGSFQYIFPEWMRNTFPFSRIRPLHVSMVISWIFTAASGGIYFFIREYTGKKLYSETMAWVHAILLLFVLTGTFSAYSLGKFGGREYLEFPAWIGVPLIAYWLLFMFNFFQSMKSAFRNAPVYIWMWSTGLIFFLITFLESQLWLLNFFGDNIVRDTVVQWKALGSMVGSWNMLIYGTAFYLMEKIAKDDKISRSPLTFFFYFLGLTNLMFNWGHHTYIVPASPWIKHVAYIISMTELLILFNIIRLWRSSLQSAQRNFYVIPYRFISAADFWIFLNLILAIVMSVPAINAYTHGTHITVAHAMGTTIGINSMILFASISYMSEKKSGTEFKLSEKKLKQGFWISNISLLIFWIALLLAGFTKSVLQDTLIHPVIFQKMMPYFKVITISGIFMLIGFSLMIIPLLKINLKKYMMK
ncbi:MAG: cbb3-type cytochrome c oxidase subunit I [Bacteroidia bacterium]|nr:cbb3-type cytochrome c oxidase subunit I [Bacteroidia bacterium]